jgi:hypothetical protein
MMGGSSFVGSLEECRVGPERDRFRFLSSGASGYRLLKGVEEEGCEEEVEVGIVRDR